MKVNAPNKYETTLENEEKNTIIEAYIILYDISTIMSKYDCKTLSGDNDEIKITKTDIEKTKYVLDNLQFISNMY